MIQEMGKKILQNRKRCSQFSFLSFSFSFSFPFPSLFSFPTHSLFPSHAPFSTQKEQPPHIRTIIKQKSVSSTESKVHGFFFRRSLLQEFPCCRNGEFLSSCGGWLSLLQKAFWLLFFFERASCMQGFHPRLRFRFRCRVLFRNAVVTRLRSFCVVSQVLCGSFCFGGRRRECVLCD